MHTVIAGGITQNNHKESPHRVREWEHNMSRWRHQKEFTLLKGSVTGLDWRLGTTEDKYCRATKIRQSTRLHQRKCELSFSRALAIRNYSWDSMSAHHVLGSSLDLSQSAEKCFCDVKMWNEKPSTNSIENPDWLNNLNWILLPANQISETKLINEIKIGFLRNKIFLGLVFYYVW